MQTFVWKQGCRFRGKAQDVGERIEKVKRDHSGTLKPVHVVADARNKASPLHALFEWDNRKAADAYRLDQAQRIISSIEVKITTSDGDKRCRAYVSLVHGNGRNYHGIEEAMNTASLRELLLIQALAEVESWRDRYESYVELARVFSAIQSTKKRLSSAKLSNATRTSARRVTA